MLRRSQDKENMTLDRIKIKSKSKSHDLFIVKLCYQSP